MARVFRFNRSYLFILCAMAWLAASGAWAKTMTEDRVLPSPVGVGPCVFGACGGGGQPDPLTIYNQFVELADGEYYLLKGRIIYGNATAPQQSVRIYFEVDLKAHPWLGGRSRRGNPIYPIEGELRHWDPVRGNYGELAAQAHLLVQVDSKGRALHVVTLKPIVELSKIGRP